MVGAEIFSTHFDESTAEKLGKYISRNYVSSDSMTFAKLTLKAGAEVSKHSHHNEQVSFILQGEMLFRFYFDDAVVEKLVVGGDFLIIPPHVPHEVFAQKDSIDLDFFTPPRLDWEAIGGNDYLAGADDEKT